MRSKKGWQSIHFTASVQYETLYARSTRIFNEVFMCAVCGVQKKENEEERSTQNEEERSMQNQENQENQENKENKENVSDF